MAAANGFPRRRHRNSGFRDSSEEGHMELQETVRLRERASKVERGLHRDRDCSFGRSKRRRGSHPHAEDGVESTDESCLGNEEKYEVEVAGTTRILSPNSASSASDQINRRSLPPARPLRQPSPAWKVTDEIIGVTVPRRARSASSKRLHESWVSASVSGEEQSNRQNPNSPASPPSSSDFSVRKKTIEPKSGLPKSSKLPSNQEEIEIEIAEVLYGLMTSKKSDPSESHNVSTPSDPLLDNALNTQVGAVDLSNPILKSSVKVECEKRPLKEEASSSSEVKRENSNIKSETRDGIKVNEVSLSCSEVDAQRHDSKAISGLPESNTQQEEKFEIDLMAPPPISSSPERDGLDQGLSIGESNSKPISQDVVLTREEITQVEGKVERPENIEKLPSEELVESKMEIDTEKRNISKLDLEKPNEVRVSETCSELPQLGRKQEHQPNFTNTAAEKTDQSSSVPLPIAVTGWPSGLPPGYLPPFQTVMPTNGMADSSTKLQPVRFMFSQPRRKRCVTHHSIAHSIFLHQQATKTNHIWPAALESTLRGAQPHLLSGMASGEHVVVGKQLAQSSPSADQATAREKGRGATNFLGHASNKSLDVVNSKDILQGKELVLQQGPQLSSTGNLLPGPAFIFPLSQHQGSITTLSTQVGEAANSTSNASLPNSSAAGAVGISSALPTAGAVVNSSYPNSLKEGPFFAIVQNNGYPLPFSTPIGTTPAIRGGSHSHGTSIFSGTFYSSQTFDHSHLAQQRPHLQTLVQQNTRNSSTSSVSSSSHKQPYGTQVSANNVLTSSSMQLQHLQKQHATVSHQSRKPEADKSGESAQSVSGRTSYPPKSTHGQNFAVPASSVNLSFRTSATLGSASCTNGNHGEKLLQSQNLAPKGGVELMPSQPFAISFAAFNGTGMPSNLNFSSIAPNQIIFPNLPDMGRQGYIVAGMSQTAPQKNYLISEVKMGGKSSHAEDEKKGCFGKSSAAGPTTLVFDNSVRNLDLFSSPVTSSWPACSITSTAITTHAPAASGNSNSHQPQMLQLQKQHIMPQQQPTIAARSKASTSNNPSAAKFPNGPPVFSQALIQSNGSIKYPQTKTSGRTGDSQLRHSSLMLSPAPSLKNFSQQQGRPSQGPTQISFGESPKSTPTPQGQHAVLSNKQPSCTSVAGPPSGGNLKTNSQNSKGGSSIPVLQTPQQSDNSSNQKSSPVCGRNVPSILSTCPSHLSELKY